MRRSDPWAWTVLAAALGGCPPPDGLLIVNQVEVTETTTTTTTTSSDTTSTTTVVEPDPAGPRLRQVQLSELDLALELSFEVSEGDGPLAGGELRLTVDGDRVALRFPADLSSWSGGVGTVLLDRPTVGGCALGATHQVTVELVDGDGLSSGVLGTERTTSDQGLVLSEIGDSVVDLLGIVGPGTRICGELDRVGNDGEGYTGDRDMVEFEVDPSTMITARLEWAGAADYDLHLFESDGELLTVVDSAATESMAGPEELDASLRRGQPYVLLVVGWEGSPGTWTLDLF
jgi:hypothetical protein